MVGYQTVQSSNQKIITAEVNEKDLLFQTLVDMANNKEIQRVILGSELTSKKFFVSDMRFSAFTHPVQTKRYLNFAYHFGWILSKTISKTKIHSLLERYQVNNQGVQKGINAVIEKDAKLKGEMMQLSSLSCDCEKSNATSWNFPVICVILWSIGTFFWILGILIWNIFHKLTPSFEYLYKIITNIASTLNCFWYPY